MGKNKKYLLFYLSVSLVWIFGTDLLLNSLALDKGTLVLLQHTKGVVFVLLTFCYMYYLVRKKENFIAVNEERQKLRTLINSMADFINFKDGQGRWIEVNEFGLKLFQLEGVDYRGKKDSELAEYTDFYRKALLHCEISDQETWKNGKITRCLEVLPMPDGTSKTFDTTKIPIYNSDGSRKELVVMGRDITDKIKAEKKIKESEQKYKSLFKYNPELVFMVDPNGIFINVNPKFEKLTGYKPSEYIGKSAMHLLISSEQEKAQTAITRVVKNKSIIVGEDLTLLRKDGKIKRVSCGLVPMITDNQIVGAIGYAVDITNAKENEEKLRKTEKLSVVGELSASVAHEIRNPLTSLKGFAQFLRESNPENDFIYKIMIDELNRINDIVSELLILAKPQEVKYQVCNINDMFSSVLSLLESQANMYGVIISLHQEKILPSIHCEPNQLKQVFINIIKNSIEANSTFVRVTTAAKEDGYIHILIEDDGIGIEEARLKHLGEPFYSAKEKGTGLGLTVSYRIIESHQGEIHYHSKVNEGTKVVIKLPLP
ncbi:PAS domain-containing sensor histidine kinase [Bacillus alkalicellulosilyticus]|uniref:PAS domain-containing sensor histidine kinase n=1 Tax=Alkalihalobacterium alkalicellulosilyticum TaxID=1912214 RepID=UPI000995E3F7|nr:PAS domain-containing sensor histidine kinase [Bacillus alkalicellulosilyticus]